MKVGRALVYLSLVFSLASAAQYVGLFATAVEAKDNKLKERQAPPEASAIDASSSPRLPESDDESNGG